MTEFDEGEGSPQGADETGGDTADLTPSQIAGYESGDLSAEEQAEVEAHLAICPRCREELAIVTRLAEQPEAGPRSRIWRYGAPLAAAAVLLVVLGRGLTDGESDILRGPEDALTRTERLEAVAPAVQVSRTSGLEFVWRSAGLEAEYRFTLSDAAGRILWRTNTTDTVARLPQDVPLELGATFYWLVDAMLPDGRTVTTGARALRPVVTP